ncbi:flagellar hook-associated protein FlgL [Paenibacillus aurantius]|uniref:Flagellar hook-associated protein FlgL n=1 Tax=Paenibacillus aurantius TaxID=2918900 RepID=A0AA96LGD7_9BACL|nr:flagellar hook-associated protein FlgL [Paenibacillus aurantius]WNQ11600.1 flagellar hook-associated protein FlgL [Paenibacillus aurantius]
MPYRVTQGMMSSQLMRNLNANLHRMDKWQNQMSTGRKINAPSDDPVGITFSMRYRSELTANDQYQRNVDSAVSWLDYTDTTMNQAGSVLQRLRELAVNGSNGTNPDTAMKSIQSEVGELYNQMIDIANSTFNGKAVFNGQNTTQAPYPKTGIADLDLSTLKPADSGEIKYEVGAGIKMPINVNGNEVFGGTTETDSIFQIFKELHTALGSSDYSAVSSLIGKIDSRNDKFLETRSQVGARMNRIDLIQGRLADININLQSLQSKTEDADMAEVITNMKMDENVYQASLSVGSKLIQPSLVDFLR